MPILLFFFEIYITSSTYVPKQSASHQGKECKSGSTIQNMGTGDNPMPTSYCDNHREILFHPELLADLQDGG